MRHMPVLALFVLAHTGFAGGPEKPPLVRLPGIEADGAVRLPNQWSIRPVGKQLELGDFPVNMVLHPSNKWMAILHAGWSTHEVVIVDLEAKKPGIVNRVTLEQTFNGLCFAPDGNTLYASGGEFDVVHAFPFKDGFLSKPRQLFIAGGKFMPGGMTIDSTGKTLCVAGTWGHGVAFVDLAKTKGAALVQSLGKGSYPYTCLADHKKNRLFVSLWNKAGVAVIDQEGPKAQEYPVWATEKHPTEMVLSPDGKTLYVACSNSTMVSVLDAETGKGLETINCALYARAPSGNTPNSLCLTPDGQLLFVANADANNVAVFTVSKPGAARPLGFIPVGMYPTSVRFNPADKKLYILNARGSTVRSNRHGPNPNLPKDQPTVREYIAGLYRGTLTILDMPDEKRMVQYTERAYLCSPLRKDFGVVGAPPSALFLPKDEQSRVDVAVKKAVAFLKGAQRQDGTWGHSGGPPTFPKDVAALAGLALLESGVPATDPAVVKAAKVVRANCLTNSYTYGLSLSLLFLDRLNVPADEPLIQLLAMRLVAGQTPSGGWSYQCPVLRVPEQKQLEAVLKNLGMEKWEDFRKANPDALVASALEKLAVLQHDVELKPVPTSDNSNTQFAMLALWAARRHEVPVARALHRAVKRFRDSQKPDGGWGYQVTDTGTPSMTCAGLLAMAVGYGLNPPAFKGDPLGSDRVKRAMTRLAPSIVVPKAPKADPQADPKADPKAGLEPLPALYFLWSLARVGVLYDARKIGERDWYPAGVSLLLAHQNDRGAWQSLTGFGSTEVTDTCFALLFLHRSNPAEDLTAKLQGLSNRAGPGDNPIPSKVGGKSPIKHCIYIVRENRTYDQVFGDVKEGNGDPHLCIFPEKVTPNAHRLARQFVLLDNFYAEGEVSAEGHEWSMGAYCTDFVKRTWPLTYRGSPTKNMKIYPAEGNFDDIARPAGGYIWDRCAEAGVSYRSYGEWVENGKTPKDPAKPRVKTLEGHIDPKYRGYDLDYSDVKRAERFIEELKQFEKKGDLPQLCIVRLGNDHTHGTVVGKLTPTAMVADNDLALGMVVEAISKSKFWKETAIFVVEDDAQNGSDHVDAHRTVALVISPYTKRNHVDSTMYSTASMLRTMELILNLKPMSQFDAAARPMYNAFQAKPDFTAYTHVVPKVNMKAVNAKTAWGADLSEKMDFSREDAADDLLLNEIIWRSVRGPNSKMPPPVRSAFVFPHLETEK